jgi:hypothetical protein
LIIPIFLELLSPPFKYPINLLKETVLRKIFIPMEKKALRNKSNKNDVK